MRFKLLKKETLYVSSSYMKVKLHKSQYEVATDKHRFKVICAGRRWGKSTLSELIVLQWAFDSPGMYWIVSPTYRQGKEIHWLALKQVIKPEWITKTNETELSITLINGAIISLKGAENPDALRGSKLKGLVIDEIASIANWNWLWHEVLRPTLVDYQAPALFISTPKGYNHFYELYIDGQGKKQEYKSWRFSSYDNPYVPVDEIEKAKQDESPDVFSQEYLAEFTRFTGLIYKEFDQNDVQFFTHKRNDYGEYIAGLDFAVRGWTACLPSFLPPQGDIYHLDEYKVQGLTAKEHARAIITMLTSYADLAKWTIYADPAGWMKNQQKNDMIWAIADEYIEEGLPLVRANNSVVAGINYVRQLHKQHKIHIHPRCTSYVEEKIRYQWKEQSEKQISQRSEPEEVRKLNDHLMDCERYELYSKPLSPEEEVVERPTLFPDTFPIIKLDVVDENADKYEEIDTISLYDA